MPYIKRNQRIPFEDLIKKIELTIEARMQAELMDRKELAGFLTYLMFRLCKRFYVDQGWYDMSDVGKICDSVWDEFKRRFRHPYEDKKIQENGDVP